MSCPVKRWYLVRAFWALSGQERTTEGFPKRVKACSARDAVCKTGLIDAPHLRALVEVVATGERIQ